MSNLLSAVPIEYQTTPNEKLPKIGVYYMFSGSMSVGLCHEFKLELGNLRTSGDEIITPKYDFAFITEQRILEYLTRHQFQAIRTRPCDGVSFNEIAKLVSQLHFQDFLGRHKWIRHMN